MNNLDDRLIRFLYTYLNNSVTSLSVAWNGTFLTKILVPVCLPIFAFFLVVETSCLKKGTPINLCKYNLNHVHERTLYIKLNIECKGRFYHDDDDDDNLSSLNNTSQVP